VRVGLEPVNGVYGDTDTTVFDSNVVVVPISVAALGVTPGRRVTMTVSTWSPYAADPGGLVDEAEPFTVDPYAPQYWFDGGTPQSLLFEAAPGTPVTVHRDAAAGEPAAPLLVLHTHNGTTAARAQVLDVTAPVTTPTATTLAVTGTPAVGSPLTLTATVTPPGASGAVEFIDADADADGDGDAGGTVLATAPVQGGLATATVRLGAGEHRVTARFVPDGPLWGASASSAVPVDVPQAASGVDVRLSDRAISYGDLTTATVEVTAEAGTPSGTVEVLVGDEVVATGQVVVDGPGGSTGGRTGTATIDLPRDVAVGGHRVTARYTGADDVAASSDWLRLRVTPAAPGLTVTADDWTVRPGSRPTVTVTLPGQDGAPAPTGRVTVLVNLQRLVSEDLGPDGTVTVTLPPVGRVAVVTAIYGGDHGYRPDAAARALRVR
jgi:hypothetical protein